MLLAYVPQLLMDVALDNALSVYGKSDLRRKHENPDVFAGHEFIWNRTKLHVDVCQRIVFGKAKPRMYTMTGRSGSVLAVPGLLCCQL